MKTGHDFGSTAMGHGQVVARAQAAAEQPLAMEIVVPWVDRGCEHRRRAFEFVKKWWDTYPVVVSSPDPFAWGVALNDAIEEMPDDAIVVHSDPDSFVPHARLVEAVQLAAASDGLVIPFDRYGYLTAAGAGDFYRTGCITRTAYAPSPFEFEGQGGSGNVTVYSRRTWEQAGGYDPRFGTWGGADGAFAFCCDALVAPTRRLEGLMVHLWHPRLPESKPGGPGYAEQFAMVAEYRDAAGDADALRALIEARA